MNDTNYTPGDLVDHVAVSAVIKDVDGKILMFKHKKFGFWTIPIGKAEPGESAYQGMCTEVKEECGITVIKAKEIAKRPYSYSRDGKIVNLIHHLFEVEKYEGKVRNGEPEKHPSMQFMTVPEIRQAGELSDATLLFLETPDAATT